jgi:hypothetical protein
MKFKSLGFTKEHILSFDDESLKQLYHELSSESVFRKHIIDYIAWSVIDDVLFEDGKPITPIKYAAKKLDDSTILKHNVNPPPS